MRGGSSAGKEAEMVESIALTASMRSNLSSLKSLASQMGATQTRLSTGRKVNSAIDNASSYYQARALSSRAADLNALLDSMGQSIQTINTAAGAIDSATGLFEQMASISAQAASVIGDVVKLDSTMTTAQIQGLLDEGGTFSLSDDIILSQTLEIRTAGTTIIGNGHSITYAATRGFSVSGATQRVGESALNITAESKLSGVVVNYSNTAAQGAAITIAGARAEVDNLTVNASTSANRVYGVQVWDGGSLAIDRIDHINVSGDYSEKLVNGNPDMFAGEYNTKMIVDQIGDDGVAAWACYNFFPSLSLSDDENFGRGTWYLPSLGELAELYGTDFDQIGRTDQGYGVTGAIGDVKAKVNAALATLSSNGANAATLTSSYYWSSSENFLQLFLEAVYV